MTTAATITTARLGPHGLYVVAIVCPRCSKVHEHAVAGSLTAPGLREEHTAPCHARRSYRLDDADEVFADAIGAETQASRLAAAYDVLGRFLGDVVHLNPASVVLRSSVYPAYVEWAQSTGHPLPKRRTVLDALTALPGVRVGLTKGNRTLRGVAYGPPPAITPAFDPEAPDCFIP